MNKHIFSVGKQVQITRPGPGFGTRGMIRSVSVVEGEGRELVWWYLIDLPMRGDPAWFKHSEVEVPGATPFAVQARWS